MTNNDYICIYRQFFEEFAKTFQMEECRPMRVNLYNLTIEELVGEVMHSCVNFFTERKCPRGLIVPLTKIVVEEFLNEAKKQPEEVNTPLKLNRKTHDKIYEVCLRFTDNEKLSNLPRPVPETYYSTHSTKHTRRRMEDRLICLPRFNALHSIQSNSEAGYYGIFDGHNGVNAACYAVSHLHQFLAESEFYPDDPVQAFRQAFEKTESKYNLKDENSGTTALAILHQPEDKKLIVCWVGDSQAMLSCEDSYVMLVDPHKPERKDERKRIEDLGGFIIKAQGVYRVNGGLAISRAIGDKKLKPHVSAEPEIRVLKLTGSEHFIVMGCDGLWDVVEPQQVIDTVYFEVRNSGGQIDTVGRRLVDLAKENNSTDNISVIVIFLTDPAEISNRSINASGHRPKILLQDGVIMETNFQGSEKSPVNEPGMNGIYGANGNHLDDHAKNESDEDFGPETDVDAVDDVLSSPKNSNPFANECWQKSQTSEEVCDKLIEFSRQETADLKEEIMKFSDEFAESFKNADHNQAHDAIKSDAIKLDSFSVNSMNLFETSVVNNTLDVSRTSITATTDDDNKLVDDTDSKKGEKVDNFMISNYVDDESFDSKNHVGLIRDPDQSETNNTSRGSENSQAVWPKENLDLFTAEGEGLLDGSEDPVAAEPIQKDLMSKPEDKVCAEEFLSSSNTGLEHIAITTETTDVPDPTLRAKEPPLNLPAENLAFDAIENAEGLCSSEAPLEAKQQISSEFLPMEENTFTKEKEGATSTLFPPSAPALNEEAKDEVVAESGGEVEDSEDDEWNYIKVKSVCEVPTGNDSVPTKSNESSEAVKSMINSPLNPNAAEFVPVFQNSVSTAEDFKSNETPKKTTSHDLTDIVASSPNWMDLQNVSLPDESAFLDDIKSKPSNVLGDIDFSQQILEDTEDVNKREFADISANVKFTTAEGTENTKELKTTLASGTCNFVDSKTTPQNESHKEQLGLSDLPGNESIAEKKDLFFSENASSNIPELKQTESEISAELPNLLPPISGQDNIPRDTSKLIEAETHTDTYEPPQGLAPIVNETEASGPGSLTQEPAPLLFEEPVLSPKILAETCDKLTFDDKPNETLKTAGGTISAVGATAAVPRKDDKTASPRTANIKVNNKTSTTAKPPPMNGTKSSSPTKKPATSNQQVRTSKTTKTVTATTPAFATGTKTAAPKVPSVSKTVPKPSSPSTFAINKVPARLKPAAATSLNPKAGALPKTTSTACATKSDQNLTKTSASTAGPKPKPRVPPSGLPDKKAGSAPSGDVKTSIKRTEASSKKSDLTATTATSTRVSMSARPATAPAKPTSLKTTATTTRTVTAKPRTIVSNITSTSTVFSATRASPTAKKTAPGFDKQAKELANRITSKTSTVTKANGVAHGKTTTTTVTKTRKTLTSTITTIPSKTKNENKTEPKAEETRDQIVEIVQSEKNDNNNDDNLIGSIASN